MPVENPSTSDGPQSKDTPAQILVELGELDEALYHLNDRYGQCVCVTPRTGQKALQKHLLERSDEHLITLSDILRRLHRIDAPPQVQIEVQKISNEIKKKLVEWYRSYHSCISSERYDDDLGINARRIILEVQAKLECVLRAP